MARRDPIAILHIFNDPKFSGPFFEFLIRHGVSLDDHFLFHIRCPRGACRDFGMRHIFARGFFSLLPNLRMLGPLLRAEKIVIHSLASPFLLLYLWLFPSLARRSFWVIWGKDLYFYRLLEHPGLAEKGYEFLRRRVIPRIGHIVTDDPADYDLCKRWYKARGRYLRRWIYPSSLYKGVTPVVKRASDPITVLVGNSADPTNDHATAFELLAAYRDCDMRIVLPLSYGDQGYADRVERRARELFGDRVTVLRELMAFEDYLRLLAEVDIGLFANTRQQGVGTQITLLGMGRPVYLRREVSTFDIYTGLGVCVFDISEFSLARLTEEERMRNIEAIKLTYSARRLLENWRAISGCTTG